MPDPDLIPVDHDPFPGLSLVPVDHDPFGGLAAVAKPMQTLQPTDVMGGINTFRNSLAAGGSNVLGLSDAAKAFRGELTPEEAQTFALGAIPAVFGGPEVKAAEEAAPAIARGIRAFHGSPYDFERFDLSKIGTGEGAQAYGHGLYFAEQPKVAEQYKADLSDATVGGQPYDVNSPVHMASALLHDYSTRETALSSIQPRQIRDPGDFWDRVSAILKSNEQIPKYEQSSGKMYEVNIAADPEHFLDWDKPLSEQSEVVKQKLAAAWLAHPEAHANQTGEQIYRDNQINFHQPNQGHLDTVIVAQKLQQAGIPGIKYLDQGSRASGVGTSNYVVFDDKLIDIIKKYGLAGLIAGGAAHFKTQPVDHDPFVSQ